ncbi:TIGR02444 family protein [Glaciecola sp. MH2013]|nr:TIGR02444 family protein [Glaciecola sp. MH2013]
MCSQTFWDFSLSIYGDKEVQMILLHLQDKYQCNVNMLLFMIYLTRLQISLNHQQCKLLIEGLHASEKELSEFREQRRAAKLGSQHDASLLATYEGLLSDELVLEKKQQALLVNLCQSLLMNDQDASESSKELISNLLVYVTCIQSSGNVAIPSNLIRELEQHV